MAVLERKVKINPNEFQYGKLNNTQESIFNEFLDSVSDFKTDPQYEDDQHLLLSKESGDIYYFDSYKYIYPVQYDQSSFMEVINNNIGVGEIAVAGLYEENKFFIEHYVGEESMERLVYNLPSEYLADRSKISQFLLYASSLHPSVISSLEKISETKIAKYQNNIQYVNENGEIIYEQPATNSFFNDCNNIMGNIVNLSGRKM